MGHRVSEQVYSYFDYDGETELPEEGVADFRGAPHYFWLRKDLDARHGVFDIVPIDDALLSRVVESQSIFHAWDVDYHAGRVELETHPMRPGMNDRFVTLRREICDAASALREKAFQQNGLFSPAPSWVKHSSQFAGRRWPIPGLYSFILEVTWAAA